MGGLESNADRSYIRLQVFVFLKVYHLYRKLLIESGMFSFLFCYSNSAVKMLVIYVCFASRSVEGCWLKYVTFFPLFLFGVKLYSNKIPNQVSKRLLVDYASLFICVFN